MASDDRVRDPGSHLQYQWHGQVFVAPEQRLMLLGHHPCLSNFNVTF
jgi:hypothetical protein